METNGPPFQGRQTFPITVMHGSNCNTCRVHSWMYMHCYVMHWGSRLLTYWGDRLFSVLTIRCCRNRFYLCMSYLFNTQIKLTMAKTQRNSQLCTVGWQGFRVHHTPIRSTHALAQVYALGYAVRGQACHVMFPIVPTNYEGCEPISRHTSIRYFQSGQETNVYIWAPLPSKPMKWQNFLSDQWRAF